MDTTLAQPPKFRVPPPIKRNMALFSLAQSFTGAGMSFAFGLGPLMVLALTHSAALVGVAAGLMGLSRFLIAYPIGKVTDHFGRKPGILMGLSLALVGAVVTGASMALGSFAVLVAGLLLFGMGMSGAQQLRVAATDMFPPQRRAEALGYLALGSLVGLVVGPSVVQLAEHIAKDVGQDALGLPWLMLPALIVPGMLIISFVRPDPKTIGMNLAQYYPGHVQAERGPAAPRPKFRASRLLRFAGVRRALIANGAAQGNMTIVMVLTSLVLQHHGHSLTAIAWSHMFHSMGMFSFTIPLGRLADRFGRERVMYPGVMTALIGAGLVAFTGTWESITLGTFLVGIGWAAANVAATATIADQVPTQERGRAIGVNESIAGGINVSMAVVTGPLVEWAGLWAAGLVAVAISLPPLFLLAASRMQPHGAASDPTLKN